MLSYSEESVVPMHTTSPLEPLWSEDLLGALHWLERPGRPLGVGCFFGDLLSDGRELFGGDCRGVITALNLTIIGALEGGADGDDPA